MKCEYCSNPVFGQDGITVLGVGVAHKKCLETQQILRRVFNGIDISSLTDHSLNELHDLVLSEMNCRKQSFQESNVELF